MLKKVFVFATLALGIASAESYRINLAHPSVVKGIELKPGDYRLNVEQGKATLKDGKQTIESAVRVESSDRKFPTTVVRYNGQTISEIRLGGTSTKIIFTE